MSVSFVRSISLNHEVVKLAGAGFSEVLFLTINNMFYVTDASSLNQRERGREIAEMIVFQV